jgi:hypothetical protein
MKNTLGLAVALLVLLGCSAAVLSFNTSPAVAGDPELQIIPCSGQSDSSGSLSQNPNAACQEGSPANV